MKKKIAALLVSTAVCASMIAGCGSSSSSNSVSNSTSTISESTARSSSSSQISSSSTSSESTADTVLADGTYTVKFTTDSSMFHINDEYNDEATLTVNDGKMSVHITLVSKNIVNLFLGTAADAQKDGAELIQPTTDTVEYSDGSDPDEVYGFDVPVKALDQEFDLALIGTQGVWYDHKVSVSQPI